MVKHVVEQPKRFEQHRVVCDDEIDGLGHVSNVSYVRWIQDVAEAHSAAVGWDYARYLEHGVVFVVRRHEVDYLRPALPNDEVQLETWVDSWSAATSIRLTRITRCSDGVELARAATTWALVAADSGRPKRIGAELRAAFSESPAPP